MKTSLGDVQGSKTQGAPGEDRDKRNAGQTQSARLMFSPLEFGPRWPFRTVVALSAVVLLAALAFGAWYSPIDCSGGEQTVIPLNLLGVAPALRGEAERRIQAWLETFRTSRVTFDIQFTNKLDPTRVNIELGAPFAVSGREVSGKYAIRSPWSARSLQHELGHGFLGDWFKERNPGRNLISDFLINWKLTLQRRGISQEAFRCGAAALAESLRAKNAP
jgi:hypothetical protein